MSASRETMLDYGRYLLTIGKGPETIRIRTMIVKRYDRRIANPRHPLTDLELGRLVEWPARCMTSAAATA